MAHHINVHEIKINFLPLGCSRLWYLLYLIQLLYSLAKSHLGEKFQYTPY